MKRREKKIIKFIICLGFLFLSRSFLFSHAAEAATLLFSPASGSYVVGDSISIGVYVSSLDKTMNAASGTVSFPSDKLEIISVSKANSIFSLWVQEPVFSNSTGTLNFEGIVLNPGFNGASGKVITINFRVKAMGSASLAFTSGAILANDGQGTNIINLADSETATFIFEPTISGTQAPKTSTPSGVAGTPLAPVVTSGTHPDPEKWYPTNNPQFNWQVSADVIGLRFSYSSDPRSIPSATYDSSVISKEYKDIPDGTWYFHLQFKNKNGWGSIAHFRFQIDTRSPDPFMIAVVSGSESGNPRPTITFETNDSLSGVDYYKIKIGDGDFVSKLSEEIAKSNPYTLPIQSPGKHTLVVQAVDKAGNATTAVEEFVITALEAPFIDDYPRELSSGAPLIIRGRTYPSANVILWLQLDSEEPKSQSVRSDDAGNFIYISAQKLENGIYKLWSEALNDYGARSNPSEVLGFVVQPATLLKIGSLTINILTVAVSIIALLAVLIFIIWQVRRRFFIFGRNVNQEHKEVKKIEGDVYQTLVSLRAQIDQQAETLKQIKQSNPSAQEEKKQEKQQNFNADNIHESGTGGG